MAETTESKLYVTVHGQCNGFHVEIAMDIAPQKLSAALDKLRTLGIPSSQLARTLPSLTRNVSSLPTMATVTRSAPNTSGY